MIWAIDPGPEQSALVVTRADQVPVMAVLEPNEEIVQRLRRKRPHDRAWLALEMVECRGMPIGATTLDTCVWIGRFIEAWPGAHRRIKATAIRHHICGTPHAKKKNVRQALLDRYPATGGGATPQIGTKKQPGPLYGFSNHLWSALSVAVTAAEVPA